jgi:hypothetical protein
VTIKSATLWVNDKLSTWINYLNGSSWYPSLVLHSGAGYFLVHNAAKVFPLDAVIYVFIASAAAKEFYWDKHFEKPPQAFRASGIDWSGYFLGTVLAVVLS